jgi:hypothetical protein
MSQQSWSDDGPFSIKKMIENDPKNREEIVALIETAIEGVI